MTKKLFGLTAVLALIGVNPVMAQIPIEIEPYVGVYIPFADLANQVVDGADVLASQKEALAVGGRLGLGLGIVAVEGNFMYAFSDGESTEDGETVSQSAGIWVADARLLLKLLPGPISLHVSGGPAFIGRSGDFYSDVTDGKTDLGGAVGAGLRVKLPGILAIRGDADLYLYSSKLTVDTGIGQEELDSQFQADLVLSAGLVISL
jgi:hypothetical protein